MGATLNILFQKQSREAEVDKKAPTRMTAEVLHVVKTQS